MKIFVVIPLYNERNHIAGVLRGVGKFDLESVVVDDGSEDRGASFVKGPGITLIKHKVNLGKGAAMKTGADYAFKQGAEAIIFMDSDGQHEANDLAVFIDKLKQKRCDVVFGTRSLKGTSPMARFMGNKIAFFVIKFLFGISVTDPLSGFRALTKNAYKKIKWESSGYGVESEMIVRVSQAGLKYMEVPIKTVYLDNNKGVSMLDALGILSELIKWKLTG